MLWGIVFQICVVGPQDLFLSLFYALLISLPPARVLRICLVPSHISALPSSLCGLFTTFGCGVYSGSLQPIFCLFVFYTVVSVI